MIGGDIVLRSTTSIDESIFIAARDNNLDYSLSVSSFTMASHKDDFLLSSVRAVDNAYPLKGKVSTQLKRDSEPTSEKNRPVSGEAWVERRFLDRLNVELGDQIEVGEAEFTLTKILELEPDRTGSLYALNPRVLINWQDLQQTKLVQPGSRLWYKLMLSGGTKEVEAFVDAVEDQLNSSQCLVEPQGSADQIDDNLKRANAFINLGALLSVILCGIAVSLAASRHARRHIDQVALLRCFGLKSSRKSISYTLYSCC